jgi:AcrR family transcriptional regulator
MAKPLKREPKSEKAQATKRAILEATTHILLKSGLDAVSTNSIATKAGVSIGSLYQYYDGKEEIFLDLLEELLQRRQDNVRDAFEVSMLLESIDSIVGKVIDACLAQNEEDAKLETVLIPVSLQNSNKQQVIRLIERFEQFARPALKGLLLMKNPSLRKRDLDMMIFILIQSLRGIVIAQSMPWGKGVDRAKLKAELQILISGYVGKKN